MSKDNQAMQTKNLHLGNSGMGGAMMNRGGGDMQFASDRFAQPPAQNRFNPMMGTFSNNRNWPQ